MVLNKIDLVTEASVQLEEAARVASELGLRLYRTSVKEDINVDIVFQHLAEDYVQKVTFQLSIQGLTMTSLSLAAVTGWTTRASAA